MTDKPTPAELPKPILVECDRCESVVLSEIRGQSEYYDPEDGPPERWSFVVCIPAQHPMLVLQNEYYGIPFDEDIPWRAYPPQDRVLSAEIPAALRRELEEARTCFKAKAYSATVVMSGRVIEGVCAEFGASARSLDQSLQKMRDEGHIDGKLADWAHLLRGVRNAGAHFDESKPPIERQDAADALAFSEALLDYLFVLKARFDQLRDRRTPNNVSAEEAVAALVSAGGQVVETVRARRRAKKAARDAVPVPEGSTGSPVDEIDEAPDGTPA